MRLNTSKFSRNFYFMIFFLLSFSDGCFAWKLLGMLYAYLHDKFKCFQDEKLPCDFLLNLFCQGETAVDAEKLISIAYYTFWTMWIVTTLRINIFKCEEYEFYLFFECVYFSFGKVPLLKFRQQRRMIDDLNLFEWIFMNFWWYRTFILGNCLWTWKYFLNFTKSLFLTILCIINDVLDFSCFISSSMSL